MKKIVFFGLLLNCSLLVYAMDNNDYELITVVQKDTRQGTRTNVILGAYSSTKKTDKTWECKLDLYSASDVLLGASHPPVEKKFEFIFSAN